MITPSPKKQVEVKVEVKEEEKKTEVDLREIMAKLRRKWKEEQDLKRE